MQPQPTWGKMSTTGSARTRPTRESLPSRYKLPKPNSGCRVAMDSVKNLFLSFARKDQEIPLALLKITNPPDSDVIHRKALGVDAEG